MHRHRRTARRRRGARQGDLCGNADHRHAFGNVLHHHGIGAHAGITADRDGAKDFGACAHHHAIFDHGVAAARFHGRAAQRDTMIEGHIVADDGGFADHDAQTMIDEEVFADNGAGVDLNP